MKDIEYKKVKDYEYYLNKLKKEEIQIILNTYQIKHNKNLSKNMLIKLILENVDLIVEYALDIFQQDELYNIKLLVKKNGYMKVKINHLLLCFFEVLKRNNLLFSEDGIIFEMPSELVLSFKNKLKSKAVLNKIKSNADEYNLILGYIDVYGFRNFKHFYDIYFENYHLSYSDALQRIKKLAYFYGEFKIFVDKNNIYLSSNNIKTIKVGKEFIPKKKNEYKDFLPSELVAIHNFDYFNKKREYKKLKKFISKSYDVEKGSFKIINRFILVPYLIENQICNEDAYSLLSTLIDKYFEFNNEKHKNKFISLVEGIVNIYPSWKLNGYNKKEKR